MSKYISTKNIKSYLYGKTYSSIHITGSVRGMKKLFGWNKASEIIRSGNYIYAIFSSI